MGILCTRKTEAQRSTEGGRLGALCQEAIEQGTWERRLKARCVSGPPGPSQLWDLLWDVRSSHWPDFAAG